MIEITPFLFFIVLGTLLIAAELLIFNLSVFWFLFIGIGAIGTAIIVWLIPETRWVFATSAFVILSAVVSLLLYKPLQRWQQTSSSMAGNDAIGQTVDVLTAIQSNQSGKVNWSGVDWEAALAENSQALAQGDRAEIVSVKGIVLVVRVKN